MKTMKQLAWTLAALLIWLTGSSLAQAFYNPNSGKWLSRDPVEEKGGLNMSSFVFNSPILRYDILGKICPDMRVTDLGHRTATTNTLSSGDRQRKGGRTTLTSWVMSPITERCFPGFSTCTYQVKIRACWSSIEYWWDTEDDKSHELLHVNTGFNNWVGLLGIVDGIIGNCYSQRKASCYQEVIESYSNYFQLDYWATGYELDCGDSPADPNSNDCRNAAEYRRRSDDASTRATTLSARCAAMP